jgi:LPXTG-site transpeptidase (sortase) family protein
MHPILPKNTPITQDNRGEKSVIPPKDVVIITPKAKDQTTPMLPKLLVWLGLFLILTQAIPLAWSVFTGWRLSASSSGFLPVSESFITQLTKVTYVDPGAAYFTSLVSEVHAPIIDQAYSKLMRISIGSAQINRVKLSANIPGNNAAVYDEVLKHGVAHLKGTSVPGDAGTTVIYGHSGVAGLLAGRNNPQIVFSRLDTVSIGDTMSIERDGKELKYVVSGKKIVDPQNLTFMSEQDAKERAILLTCWPLGIGTKRLIIIADRVQ